jgi:hypothetical protein
LRVRSGLAVGLTRRSEPADRESSAVPQSIPPGLTRDHALQALADLDAGAKHDFGDPTKYELLWEGKRFAPKAVVGLAFRYLRGQPLRPEDFSGGEAPGQANYVLRKLGFTVVRKGEAAEGDEESAAGKDWSETEVGLIVADYFAMLRAELLGQAYTKAEHRKALRPQLAGRSDGSVEFKHANISAVLVGRGLPYIEGYKPRGNYQALLAEAVEGFLDRNPKCLEELAVSSALSPEKAPLVALSDLDDIIEPAPERIMLPEPGKPWLSRRARRIDFAERDAANRRLAELGEGFVVEVERFRLRQAGRDDLARKVDWVAKTVGDGLGYDIRSFEEADDTERLLEVKATALGKFFPFYVTANEVRCSEDMAVRYHLYRVFDLSRSPRLYVLSGSLRESCRLEPTQYLAAL